MYCSLAVTPCTLSVDDAMLSPFDFSQSYAGSLIDDCVQYLRTLGTVPVSEAPRFYFWFATVQHYHTYGQWVEHNPLSGKHWCARQQRLAAFVDAIEKLFLPAWLNGTRRPVSYSGYPNDLYAIRSAADEMHWQLFQAYKGYPDPRWILQRDVDLYVLATQMHSCSDTINVGALFSAAESSLLPGMGESQEDSVICGESPTPITPEPPRAEPSSEMTETSLTCPFEAEPSDVEATPARPHHFVGPIPDFANIHYEIVDDDVTTSTSDELCDGGAYYVDENGMDCRVDLDPKALESHYFDDDTEDVEEWHSSEAYATSSTITTRSFIE